METLNPKIEAVIQKGLSFLLHRQQENGSFECMTAESINCFNVSTPPIPYYPPRQHRQLWIYFACNGFQFCGSNSFILLTG
jgi:hypothetical protein